eukprot:SM000027S09591  [mRNA]  locus=s27:271833:275583:+ [translate_table: standard]
MDELQLQAAAQPRLSISISTDQAGGRVVVNKPTSPVHCPAAAAAPVAQLSPPSALSPRAKLETWLKDFLAGGITDAYDLQDIRDAYMQASGETVTANYLKKMLSTLSHLVTLEEVDDRSFVSVVHSHERPRAPVLQRLGVPSTRDAHVEDWPPANPLGGRVGSYTPEDQVVSALHAIGNWLVKVMDRLQRPTQLSNIPPAMKKGLGFFPAPLALGFTSLAGMLSFFSNSVYVWRADKGHCLVYPIYHAAEPTWTLVKPELPKCCDLPDSVMRFCREHPAGQLYEEDEATHIMLLLKDWLQQVMARPEAAAGYDVHQALEDFNFAHNLKADHFRLDFVSPARMFAYFKDVVMVIRSGEDGQLLMPPWVLRQGRHNEVCMGPGKPVYHYYHTMEKMRKRQQSSQKPVLARLGSAHTLDDASQAERRSIHSRLGRSESSKADVKAIKKDSQHPRSDKQAKRALQEEPHSADIVVKRGRPSEHVDIPRSVSPVGLQSVVPEASAAEKRSNEAIRKGLEKLVEAGVQMQAEGAARKAVEDNAPAPQSAGSTAAELQPVAPPLPADSVAKPEAQDEDGVQGTPPESGRTMTAPLTFSGVLTSTPDETKLADNAQVEMQKEREAEKTERMSPKQSTLHLCEDKRTVPDLSLRPPFDLNSEPGERGDSNLGAPERTEDGMKTWLPQSADVLPMSAGHLLETAIARSFEAREGERVHAQNGASSSVQAIGLFFPSVSTHNTDVPDTKAGESRGKEVVTVINRSSLLDLTLGSRKGDLLRKREADDEAVRERAAVEQEKKKLLQLKEELERRERALDGRERALDEREKKQEKEHVRRERALDEREKTVLQQEKELAEKKADLCAALVAAQGGLFQHGSLARRERLQGEEDGKSGRSAYNGTTSEMEAEGRSAWRREREPSNPPKRARHEDSSRRHTSDRSSPGSPLRSSRYQAGSQGDRYPPRRSSEIPSDTRTEDRGWSARDHTDSRAEDRGWGARDYVTRREEQDSPPCRLARSRLSPERGPSRRGGRLPAEMSGRSPPSEGERRNDLMGGRRFD